MGEICEAGFFDEVDVRMGHFHAEHGHAYALAGHGGLDGQRDLAREGPQALISLLVQMEDIVVLHIFGNDEGMARSERANVEERIEIVALGALVRGNLALRDAGENGCHNLTD